MSDDTAKRELPAEKLTRVERHLSEGLLPAWLSEDDLRRQYPDSDVVAGWRVVLDDDHEVDGRSGRTILIDEHRSASLRCGKTFRGLASS